MPRWSDGDREVVEGDAKPVAVEGVSGDVVVAAAHVLHEGVTGGDDPHCAVTFSPHRTKPRLSRP